MINAALGRVSAVVQAQLTRLAREDEGATAVEYGLIIALIAGVIITVVITLGGQISQAFTTVTTNLTGHGGVTSTGQ
jgi:pilus assembly protein Flp/PilA